MSIAIIAEYNPFHNGHIFQLKEAKKRWPNEDIYIFMSGKYVQRGELAIASFASRKKIAIEYGVKDVFEIPFKIAIQAAHVFASGAIKMIANKNIDKLFFGSESNDPQKLMTIAQAIKTNENQYNQMLKVFLKQGNSFPKAAALTLNNLVGVSITLPNDILGLEYCKTIVNNNYKITPYTLARTTHFHSKRPNANFASASYIRNLIFQKKDVSQYTPMIFDNIPERIEDHYQEFQKIVQNFSTQELANIQLVSEGMENLFKKHIHATTYNEFVQRTNSKRYTSSRIKRVMLNILLKIQK